MSAAQTWVRRMTEARHPAYPDWGHSVVLYAYLDGSGDNGAEPVVVVAGFVASTKQWELFEKHWLAFMCAYEIKGGRFKAAEFWARTGQYGRWSNEKHAKAYQQICGILSVVNPFGIIKAVNIAKFDEWRASINHFVDPDAYYFCLDMCLRALIRGIAQHPHDEGIAIWIDRDPGRENFGAQMAKWHETRMRVAPREHVRPDRKVTTAYGSSRTHLPLQAADILAHASFRYARDYEKGVSDPPFLACMKSAQMSVHVDYFNDRVMFDAEWRKRAKNDSAVASTARSS